MYGTLFSPYQCYGQFTSLLDDCVLKGIWPIQLYLNLMPVLGKPQGGERCAAEAPMLYRLWCKAVRHEVRAWEREHTAEWDTAKEGSSALWPALVRGLKAEIAQGTQKEFAASLWDLHKFLSC